MARFKTFSPPVEGIVVSGNELVIDFGIEILFLDGEMFGQASVVSVLFMLLVAKRPPDRTVL